MRLSPNVLYPITATGTPPEVSLEPKVPHGQGLSPQGCWPRGTQPRSEGWAGCGAPGGSRSVTLGVPKQEHLDTCPASPLGVTRVQPQSGGVPEQDLVVLPILARESHPPHRDQQHILGIPHLSPTQERLMAPSLDTM